MRRMPSTNRPESNDTEERTVEGALTRTRTRTPLLDRFIQRTGSDSSTESLGGRSAQVSITDVSASPGGMGDRFRHPCDSTVGVRNENDGNCGQETRRGDVETGGVAETT